MITNTELLLLVWCIPVIPAYFLIKLSYLSFGETTGMILAATFLWPLTAVIMIILAILYCFGAGIDYLIAVVSSIIDILTIKRK
jgi:hypothetical protein